MRGEREKETEIERNRNDSEVGRCDLENLNDIRRQSERQGTSKGEWKGGKWWLNL